MVTAYEKKADAELTFKEKKKLFVKKPIYRPRLPRAPRAATPAPRAPPRVPPRAPKKKTRRERTREIISLIEDDEDEVDYKKEDLAESPQDRLAKIYEMKPQEQQQRRVSNRITRKRRHLLFMNPGETVIQNCILSFVRNTPLPASRPFRQNLRYNRSTARLWPTEKLLRHRAYSGFVRDHRSCADRTMADRDEDTVRPPGIRVRGFY